MTDWERVQKLRDEGKRWSEIAEDPKVGFTAPPGTNAGRSLHTLYLSRRGRPGSGRPRPSGTSEAKDPPRSYRGIAVVAAVMIVVVGGVAGYLIFVHPNPPSSDLVSYCGGEGEAEHYHILLIIIDSGSQQPLPYVPGQTADVGYLDQPGFTNSNLYCPNGGIHALHTHDGSGIVHAELPSSVVAGGVTPTLGDFFTIWGEPLDSSHVWSFTGKVTATMLDLDTKHASNWSSDPASIPFYVPAAGGTSNAYPIPQSWIFNAQYGGGSSGGVFGGEMIWLNVTPVAGAVSPAVHAWAPVPGVRPLGAGVSPVPGGTTGSVPAPPPRIPGDVGLGPFHAVRNGPGHAIYAAAWARWGP